MEIGFNAGHSAETFLSSNKNIQRLKKEKIKYDRHKL